MKKIILTLGLVLTISFANAQTTNAGTFSKPAAGSSLVEVVFTPNLSGATMFALPAFYGKASAQGLRLRKFSSETDAIRYTALLSVNKEDGDANTAIAFALGMGVEHHMKGATRLSTYWGYEGNMGYANDALKKTTLGVSAQLFTGFDYYIVPNLYLGCELNYGLSVISTVPDGGNISTSIGLNPNVSPTLRMGWKF
jgi:hypothetical protein